jgi:uncharacterized protein
MDITDEILEMMVCPACRKNIEYNVGENVLFCKCCNLKYDIKRGVPVMLIDEAKTCK